MRIILFVPQLQTGGAQQAAVLISSGMIALGHNVYIAAASLQGALIQRVNSACTLVDLDSIKPIRARKKLSELVNRIKPDGVICFGIYAGIAAALSKAAWESNPPLIIRNENNLHLDWQQATALNRVIGPLLSRWAAGRSSIVAVSRSLAPATADYLRIPTKDVTVILNPVIDDTSPRSQGDEFDMNPLPSSGSIPTFVAMGRLEHQKGFDVLIDAFSLVSRQKKCRLLIFGEGTLRSTLQAQIDALNLTDSILLAGHTPAPLAQMRSAHAFVLSSRFEGFGLVLVEALFSGTQVISTDCDYGPSEILEQGRYGRLVPVGDVVRLSEAMLESFEDANRYERPRAAWFEQFTATRAARKHIALIESLR